MAQPIDTGHGTTFVLTTSAFAAKYRSFSGFTQSREVLDSSHLETDDFRTKEPGDLVDAGEFEGEFFYDTDLQPPITGAKETGTLTLGDGAIIAGSCFVSQWTSPELVSDQLMVSNLTVTWANGPTFTDAP